MAGGWFVRLYDFSRPLVRVDVAGIAFDDVLALAKANGARHGTPYFLSPGGRADGRLNAFWRSPVLWGAADSTVRRYALSIKVWLDFLHAVDVEWTAATPNDLAAFKNWRMSVECNPDPVSANTFRLDLAAVRKLYLWAADECGVVNPVRSHVLSGGYRGETRLDATPSGIRRSDVKWMTPSAFRQWRTIGLSGYTRDGQQRERWVGRTEDRDVAYADGLYGAGLRMGEWASVLTSEIPGVSTERLLRLRLASACAKSGVSRPYWLRRAVLQAVRFYIEDGSRQAVVAAAQRNGRYDIVRNKWVVDEIGSNGILLATDQDGVRRRVNVDSAGPSLRSRLFIRTPPGLEPMMLFLGKDGLPRHKAAWYNTFRDANRRAAKELGDRSGRLWCRPHMLRHSFALRWYCIATFVAWQRTDTLTDAERRDFRNQLGDVWFLLATLLGHRSAETTRQVYLEPFQGLQIEQLVALMDADDRDALERLAGAVGAGHPRVIEGIGP